MKKEHIPVIDLMDFIADKITDENKIENISKHLLTCSLCFKVFQSNITLIENFDNLSEVEFPKLFLQIEESKVYESVSAQAHLPSLSLFERISNLKKNIIEKGLKMKGEVSDFIDTLPELFGFNEKQIPALSFLSGDEDKRKTIFLGSNIIIRLTKTQYFDNDKFSFEFTGHALFIVYESDDYRALINKSTFLITTIGYPYLFEAKFQIEKGTAEAKINIEFEDKTIESIEDEIVFYLIIE